jgi:P27 family predicted phage terminase small subunit
MWNRRAPQLLALGVFSIVDRDTLARYCLLYDLFLETYLQVKADGASSSSAAGTKKGNPDVSALRGYAADLLAIEREFGMTPSSRSSLSVSNATKEIDPLDEFLRA